MISFGNVQSSFWDNVHQRVIARPKNAVLEQNIRCRHDSPYFGHGFAIDLLPLAIQIKAFGKISA